MLLGGARAGGDKDARGPNKRRRNRIPVSCFNCRTLKTKCDGVKPTCSTCAHSGRSCSYLQQGIPGPVVDNIVVSRQYLRALEQRVEALEKRSDPGSRNILSPRTPSQDACEPKRDPGISSPETERQASSINGEPSSIAANGRSVVADANVSLGGVNFPQLILNALHGCGKVKAQSMANDNEVRERPAQISDEDLYSLPVNAAEMLNQYLSLRHTLSPVFHIPTVRPLFDAALHCHPDERHGHRPVLILLNMIFALCTSQWLMVGDDMVANQLAARKHYDIAMRLMQPNLLRDWSLGHVQALLIGARYLQASSCADECWNVLGLAIRIAYGLRLHRDPPESDLAPVRETKRRIWFAAYTLDRLTSMIYERPAAIRSAECSAQLPEDLDDDCIRADGLLYPIPKRPSTMAFSIEVIKLYRIIESLMTGLTGDTHSNKNVAELVSSLHERYRRWHRALPPCLVLDPRNPLEQPWILALRGNMVRIMIHRQSLVVALHGLSMPEQMEDPVVTKALQNSRSICINAAMETIDMVSLRHEQTKKTVGLNWFNIYYLFNAVIVLVSHVVDPANSNDKAALAKVELALQMIRTMSSNHSFAERAYSFLQQVLGYMHQSVAANRQDRCYDATAANVFHAQPTGDLAMEGQDEPNPILNLPSFLGIADDLGYSSGFPTGTLESRDLSDGLWSLGDQWFNI